jgi:ankyrin repeat protein
VRKALSSLPDNIFDYYHEAMERIEQQETVLCNLAKDALSFISHTKRPLHVNELRHALGVWASDTDFEESQCVDDKLIISICAGLVKIDETRDVVRLVHQTLQEYFETFPEQLFEDPDSKIAKACLVYLSFDVFGSGPCVDGEALQERLEHHVFLPYAAHYWGHHVRNSRDDYTKMVLKYLNDNSKLLSAVQVQYATSPRIKDWFDRYPKQIGPLHIAAWWGFPHIIKILLAEGVDITIRNSRGETPFLVAVQNNQRDAVELFLDNGNDINEQNFNGETALLWAAKNGSKDLVKFLLLRGAELITDHEGWSAINWAVIGGKCELLELLLAEEVHASTGIETKSQALFLAAEEGHKEMVKMLLDSGANINAKDSNGSTALDFAVSAAHEATVEVLLSKNADVNSTDSGGNTALHWAVARESISRLLLNYGASVNAKNHAGQTALFWTVQDSSTAVARLLLENGAESDLADKNGSTALHIAALQGHEQIAALLLQNGANADIQDIDGWTPLYGAAVQEHAAIIRLFSEKSGDSKKTLHLVARKMESPGERTLLKRVAEGKRQGSTMTSGLRVAPQEAQLGRLRMMLDRGADINAKDPAGYTALELAAFLGHKQVTQLLLEYGANVNLRGSHNAPPVVSCCQTRR